MDHRMRFHAEDEQTYLIEHAYKNYTRESISPPAAICQYANILGIVPGCHPMQTTRFYWFESFEKDWRGGWFDTLENCLGSYDSIYVIDRWTSKAWDISKKERP